MKATLCICYQFRARIPGYKNLLVDPILKISVNGIEISTKGKYLTDMIMRLTIL